MTIQGNVVADVLCSIIEKVTLAVAKYDAILVKDDADKFQVE